MQIKLPKAKAREDSFKESDFQSLLCQYIKKNYKDIKTHIGESKISHGETIRFSAFQPQQLPALLKAATKGLYFKLTDASLGTKPADYFFIRGGYVALMFNASNKQKTAYFMDIQDVMLIKKAGKKSITLRNAQTFGVEIKL